MVLTSMTRLGFVFCFFRFINSQPSHMTMFIDRTRWCFASMVSILSHVQVGSTTSLYCARVEELYRADAQNRTLVIGVK